MSTFSPFTVDESQYIAISAGLYQLSSTGFGDPADSLRIGSISRNTRKDKLGFSYHEYVLPITRTYDVYIAATEGYRPITLTCTLRVPEGIPSDSTAVDKVFSDIDEFVTSERLSQMLSGRR